jgi:hypothetical protein
LFPCANNGSSGTGLARGTRSGLLVLGPNRIRGSRSDEPEGIRVLEFSVSDKYATSQNASEGTYRYDFTIVGAEENFKQEQIMDGYR